MADVYTRIGYIKGATGATGAQGEKGDTGEAATIQVGSVTTVPYGQTANVVNSGTEQAAVFDFTIPQGRPGQQTTEMDNLLLNSITTSAAEFPVPAVGETGKVLWGKVVKWFSDMAALVATKFNVANVVNNLTTTESGYALDARQGKTLNDTLLNITPSIIVDEEIRIQNTTKNYTVPYHGLYLMFARTNASTNTAQPTLKIEDASGVSAENVGASGGSVMIHKLTVVNANTTVTLTAQNNIVASGTYNGYGRFTILLLKKL